MGESKKKLRIDFTIEEVVPLGEDKNATIFRFRLVPDKRIWKRVDQDEKKGYLNKIDKIFISDEVRAEAAKTMKGIPITVSTVNIGTEREYLEKSKKRVSKKNG